MALYFASVKLEAGQNLYTALVTHYANATKVNVPVLLPPIPRMVAWIRLESSNNVDIIGSSVTSPFYAAVQPLPTEFLGVGNRNNIDLSTLYFDNSAEVIVNLTFQIV